MVETEGAPIVASAAIERDANKKLTEEHVRARLNHLIREVRFYDSVPAFAEEVLFFTKDCQDHPASRTLFNNDELKLHSKMITEFMSGESRRLNAQSYRAIVYFLHYKKQWSSDILAQEMAQQFDDPLFHAMIGFLDLDPYYVRELTAHAPGLYRAFTPSLI